jgi:hypothetical protein
LRSSLLGIAPTIPPSGGARQSRRRAAARRDGEGVGLKRPTSGQGPGHGTRLRRLLAALRYPIVIAWIAAAVAATLYLPSLDSAQSVRLRGLVPRHAEAIAAQIRSARLFRSRTRTRRRDRPAEPAWPETPAAQRRVVQRAALVDRGRERDTDYSIFFLAGARSRLGAGEGRLDAARQATASFVPIVLTAGLIVAAGTAALLARTLDFFRAFGPGMALTALVAVAVSVTLDSRSLTPGGVN